MDQEIPRPSSPANTLIGVLAELRDVICPDESACRNPEAQLAGAFVLEDTAVPLDDRP